MGVLLGPGSGVARPTVVLSGLLAAAPPVLLAAGTRELDGTARVTGGVIEIAPYQLALSAVFILVAGVLSAAMRLRLVRSLAVAATRTFLQLGALGFVLTWIFRQERALLVVGILGLMTAVAAHTVTRRAREVPARLFRSAFLSLFLAGGTVTLAVTQVVIGVQPWYAPQYVIPIAGMIIGNSMNGMALASERFFGDLAARRDEIETVLALGASPWEASLPSARRALRAGLIPTINNMSVVGLVFIPGMMTGQVLAGADPWIAAEYQIVVMFMIGAANAMGGVLCLALSFRAAFDAAGALRSGGRERT